jgi:MFS family permease
MNKSKNDLRSVYLSWFILASFFLYQYILRSSPGVLIEEIRLAFQLNADQFSLIGSMYYYGYSLMQVPIGSFVDSKGIKKTVVISIILCLLGTLGFVITNNAYIAYLTRFIVGVGSASAFMCAVKMANDGFPKSQQGLAMGAVLAFGAFGALVTGVPLNFILKSFNDWRDAFYIFALFGLIILLLTLIFVPRNDEASLSSFKLKKILKDLKVVSSNKMIWLYAFIAIGLFTPLSVMADLWGVGFLVRKFNLTREAASPALMNIYIGMAVGSVVIPAFIPKFHINNVIKFCCIVLLFLFSLLVYVENISYTNLTILLVTIGFFCGAEMLCFTAALKRVSPGASGITIGVVNTLNMLSGAIMQQIIGHYLDLRWDGSYTSTGLREYSINDFVESFSILVVLMAICTLVAFVLLKKEKDN